MITEDYVSFETAKLLKERGFDAECDYLYVNGKLVKAQGFACNWNNGETLFADYKNECSAPTLQMAMKWLRNIHDIVCSVGLFTDLPIMPPYWSFNILNQSTANVMYEAFDVKCETYEEAAEAAIKYCLENLI